MNREEISKVLCSFYDPYDKDNPGHPKIWSAAPVEAVRKVVANKNLKWNEHQIRIVGTMLVHPSNTINIKLMRNIFESEKIIQDARHQVMPAYWSTLVMHNITFYIGVILILLAVYSSYNGIEDFSAIFGSVGLGTIIFLFFKDPVRGLQRNISNLIELEIIYNSYAKQLGYWNIYENIEDVANNLKIIQQIEMCTQRTVHLIQEHCKIELEMSKFK